MSGGFWTDEDIAELVRLVKKYPNGTISRWEIIAKQMNRPVTEVTFMSARLKDSVYRQADSVAETIVKEATKKLKKTAAQPDEKANDSIWTQDQQKLLETAIVKYPKNIAGDRWQKIANTVPGKTKEECLARYKYLVQKVKDQHKQKDTAAEAQAVEAEKEQPKEDTQNVDAQNADDADNGEDHEEASGVAVVEEEEVEKDEEPVQPVQKKSGGKPRNKRKDRKKRMEFSSDEDYDDE